MSNRKESNGRSWFKAQSWDKKRVSRCGPSILIDRGCCPASQLQLIVLVLLSDVAVFGAFDNRAGDRCSGPAEDQSRL